MNLLPLSKNALSGIHLFRDYLVLLRFEGAMCRHRSKYACAFSKKKAVSVVLVVSYECRLLPCCGILQGLNFLKKWEK